MRVLVLADLHHDFWRLKNEDHDRLLSALEGLGRVDAIILAGDISNKARVRWKHAFNDLSRMCSRDKIFVSTGNHDFYDHRLDGEDRLKEVVENEGVRWAVDQEVVLGGVRFLVTPLWVNHRLHNRLDDNRDEVSRVMNDFRYIRLASGGFRKILPRDVEQAHERHLSFLEKALSKPFSGRTVVVSHHAPHPDVLPAGETPQAAYASDLSGFLEKHRCRANLWLHGHAHRSVSVDVCGWSIRNVSLGYPKKDLDVEGRLKRALFCTSDLHVP